MITVNSVLLTVNEDRLFHQSSDLEISASGYLFDNLVLSVTPRTYTEYEEETGRDISESFQRRPDEASGDFKHHMHLPHNVSYS